MSWTFVFGSLQKLSLKALKNRVEKYFCTLKADCGVIYRSLV